MPEVALCAPAPPAAAPGQFKLATLEGGDCQLAAFNRRDFYKVSLVLTCSSRLVYNGQEFELRQPVLVFNSPTAAYSWASTEGQVTGYLCVFDEQFLRAPLPAGHQPVFFPFGGDCPAWFPDEEQLSYLQQLFARMRRDAESDYVHKQALLRSQVDLLFHEAAKMQLVERLVPPPTAAHRIAHAFLRLLDAQFPVAGRSQPLRYRRASDYASHLAVHINHLNAAVQQVTGKSTTRHLTERLLAEARALLLYTDWSIADITYGLGFSSVTYFDSFFKRAAGTSPTALRRAGSPVSAPTSASRRRARGTV